MATSEKIALIQLIAIGLQLLCTLYKPKMPDIIARQGVKLRLPWWYITPGKKLVLNMSLTVAVLALTTYYIFIFGQMTVPQLVILILTLGDTYYDWKSIKNYDRVRAEIEKKYLDKHNNQR